MTTQEANQVISDMNSGKTKWDDNIRAEANKTLDAADPIKQAQKLAQMAQDMQVEANKPAIATLQSQYNPDTGTGSLVDRYNTLIDSITASQQPAENAVTLATNNELGKRGITGDSGIAQNQIAQALLPVSTQFGQLKAQTGLNEQQDLGGIASSIAGLRAGNVGNGLNFASGITTSQNALTAAQTNAAAAVAAAKLNNQFQNVSPGNNLVNTAGNIAINPATLTSKGGGFANLNN